MQSSFQDHTHSTVTWHTQSPEAAFARLQSSPEGLSESEAARRAAAAGANVLPSAPPRSLLQRWLAQFNNLLIFVLLGAAALTMALRHWVDSGVILGVVVVNALIGVLQEGKAERALDALRHMLSPQAAVRRDGQFQTLPAERLVPGDVVMLQAGDRVPADMRLFEARRLNIDEALLTGESLPAAKASDPVATDAPLGDRSCMAFSGSMVSSGQGLGVVVAIGGATELGHISALLANVQPLQTPLLRQMARFGRWLSVTIVAIATLMFAFGWGVQQYGATDMFMAAVGLAVAAIPEGLPAIMTITLAIGVERMARRKAIIRRLPAVETLGAVTVICSDKTGTLTRNEMTVQKVVTAEAGYRVSGIGYDPHGEITCDGPTVDAQAEPGLLELLRAASLCNDASLSPDDAGWRTQGDPTELALLSLALKAGIDLEQQRRWLPRSDVIPFAAEYQWMCSLHHDHAGHGFVYVKGAPERLLGVCRRQWERGEARPLNPDYWMHHVHQLADSGLRVLALAFQPVPESKRELAFSDVGTDLMLLGLVGMIDPPRSAAVEALRECRAAGIEVKMITGDHRATAVAVARQLGLSERPQAIEGGELAQMSDQTLASRLPEVDVFARTSPEQKLRLVTALQSGGHVVAMTGDGVNDAPALRRADVGVAMGIKGTEVAKEAAEMVLADDNFASIVSAVEEGRTVYDNLRKALLFILPTNGGEALTVLAAILAGRPLPITPAQILWVNMITAVTLALALAFEPAETGVMHRPPRDPRQALMTPLFIWRVVLVSAILLAGTYGLFVCYRSQGADLATARTIAVNTLVMFEIFYLFNARFVVDAAYRPGAWLSNPAVLWAVAALMIMQAAFTYAPPMQALFDTVPLTPGQWLHITIVGSSVWFLVELEKAWLRHRVAAGSA